MSWTSTTAVRQVGCIEILFPRFAASCVLDADYHWTLPVVFCPLIPVPWPHTIGVLHDNIQDTITIIVLNVLNDVDVFHFSEHCDLQENIMQG